MKRVILVVLLLTCVFVAIPGCFTMQHTVGGAPSAGQKIEHRQWFILYGLVPIDPEDSPMPAEGASSYKVTTQWSPLDILMHFFTGWVTVYSRTITVEK